MKFRHTLSIVFLVFSLLPLYILGIVAGYENDKNIEAAVREGLASVSQTQILGIQNFCEEQKDYMELLRQYNAVKDEVLYSLEKADTHRDSSLEYVENMVKEHVRSTSYLASVSIIDAEFNVVASSDSYEQGEETSFGEAAEVFLDGSFRMGHVYRREVNYQDEKLVSASVGIYEKGELIGYIIEEIAVSYFNLYRDSVAKIEGGEMRIIDGEGEMITAGVSNKKQMGFGITEEELEDYNEKWESIKWKSNTSGSFNYTEGGKAHIAYYSALNYSDWKICINEDMSSYSERSERFRKLLSYALLIITALLLAFNFWLSKKLTRPLERIVKILLRVREEHDYSFRVGNHGKDEFGILSRRVDELLAYVEDAEYKEQEKQKALAREAECDPMTGILNKKAIALYIRNVLEEQKHLENDIAVGFVDIDNFRDYNTKYGHPAGDEVICFVAYTLKKYMGDGVGRNGGDEFLFCLTGSIEKEELERKVEIVLNKLNEGFYNKESKEAMGVSCSIGVTCAKAADSTHESLIKNADEAMYQTKEAGKNGFTII